MIFFKTPPPHKKNYHSQLIFARGFFCDGGVQVALAVSAESRGRLRSGRCSSLSSGASLFAGHANR